MSRPQRSAASKALGLVVSVVVGVLLVLWTQGDDGGAGAPSGTPSASHDYTATTTPTVDPSTQPGTQPTGSSTDPDSGLLVVPLADLPPSARDVLERIDEGGPFEFPEHDGGVFENREELLPDHPEGYYREYTVDGRPGDRGPLRIVAGRGGERYWTEDHYGTFARIGA